MPGEKELEAGIEAMKTAWMPLIPDDKTGWEHIVSAVLQASEDIRAQEGCQRRVLGWNRAGWLVSICDRCHERWEALGDTPFRPSSCISPPPTYDSLHHSILSVSFEDKLKEVFGANKS